MATKKLNEAELVKYLYNAGAIRIAESPDDEMKIDVALPQIIGPNPPIRKDIAHMFENALKKIFPDEMRYAKYRFGCVGTGAIMPIMGLLSCPIATIDSYSRVREKMDTKQPFALVDDVLRTGNTLSHELTLLLSQGYRVNTIIVFFDEEIGGQNRIHEEYKRLSRMYFGHEEKIKIVVLMPRERILEHLVEAKIISRKV
ncbi:MAG: hypothetical protein AAB482_01055 [Patescibacteria group bacterium]